MDPALAVALAAVLVAVAAVFFALRGRGPDENLKALADAQSQLTGRLSQMAEQQAAAQAAAAAQLQAQERALANALELRLGEASARISDTLTKSAETAQKTITDLRERLAKIDEAQKNIAALSTQVVGLQDILSNKQARGAFGEVQLENLVRGVLPESAFAIQHTLSNGKRADCLIRLPQPPGPICVDAKFPLESYRKLRDVRDDAVRGAAVREFGAAVLVHVNDIAGRYIIDGETAEGAMMFVPSEAVYAELHASCPGVVEQANRSRVYIVSPTTLWAVLHTMRAVLKDVRMREHAGLIQKEVGVLVEDVRRLDERVEKLQGHFAQVTRDIGDIRTSSGKILARGANIREVDLEQGNGTVSLAPPPR
jgi:DNA recombination protein RmuC